MFVKKGCFYKVNRDPNESYDMWVKRSWFVVSQYPEDDEEFKDVVKFSRIWINIRFFDMSYPSEIMDMIKKMEENVYSQ